jgi:regulator of sigma E protease
MSLSDIKGLVGTPWAILLAVFFLCASIIIHELGHFLAAKWRGLVVERFSIGFGPRLFGWTRNGVDYRVSAIPLGGYVALPQLAGVRGVEGESSSFKTEELPPLSVTNKIIVSLAGPLFNVLFAILLGAVIWMTGRPVDASQRTTTVGYVARELVEKGAVKVPGPAWEAGLRPGDRLVSIDGKSVGEWTDIAQSIATSSNFSDNGDRLTELKIVREGREMTLHVKPVLAPDNGMREIGILPEMPAVVGEVFPNSPAMRAGLLSGDRILSIDGEAIGHIFAAGKLIAKLPPSGHKLTILRGGKTLEMTLTPEMADVGAKEPRPMIGVRWAAEDKVLVHENPLAQVSNVVYMTFDVLHALINPRSDISMKDMSGPVGIAHALFLSAKEGIALLLFLVIFININLAIVNLLPIPVLDGGHIAFAIIEKIRGKPLPQKFTAASQMIFMVLLFGMMAYITLQDISREVDMAKTRKEITAAEKAPDPVFKAGKADAKNAQDSGAKEPARPETAPAK